MDEQDYAGKTSSRKAIFGDDDALHASANALGWALPLLKRNESVPFVMGDILTACTHTAGTLCGTMLLSDPVCNNRPSTTYEKVQSAELSLL